VNSADSKPGLRVDSAGVLRQLPAIGLFKIVQVAGLALFSVLAPRYLGPELFGSFAVVLSLTALWMTTSNLGAKYVFGRFVPEYAARGADDRVRALFMQMVGSRLALAIAGAPLLALFLGRALPEASTTTLALAAAAFVAMTLAAPMFAVFYGLNRLGASMGRESFGRLALLALLVALGASAGLERATLAVLLTQAAALAAGVWLCRQLFWFDRAAFDPREAFGHLRFGAAVFAANLLLRAPWRLGESALALADVAREEIAFFNVALSASVAFTRLLGEATTLQIPSLSRRQAAGDGAGRDRSLGLALKYLNVAGVLFVLAVFALGPWAVRTFWGEAFRGVVPNLLLVAPAALTQPFVRTALSLAVIESRLRRNLELGAAALAVFVAGCWLLVPRFAGLGATAALVAASLASAGVALLQMRGSGVLAEASCGRHLLVAAAPAVIVVTSGGAPWAAAAAAPVYLALLAAAGVVRRDELRRLLAGIRRPPAADAAVR
jgi:O-antigen/teichoic acid export membrane protein